MGNMVELIVRAVAHSQLEWSHWAGSSQTVVRGPTGSVSASLEIKSLGLPPGLLNLRPRAKAGSLSSHSDVQ